jgi:hypothetical protein
VPARHSSHGMQYPLVVAIGVTISIAIGVAIAIAIANGG